MDPWASPEAIRQAYRRAALRYHPDKAGSDPETVRKFQEVNDAHRVLSDPRQRALYDRFGEAGADYEQGAFTQSLMNSLGVNVFIVGSSIAAIVALICFLALLAMVACKVDGVGAVAPLPWRSVLWPVWLLDSIMLVTTVAFLSVILRNRIEDGEHGQLEPIHLIGPLVVAFFVAFTALVGAALDDVPIPGLAIFAPLFCQEMILIALQARGILPSTIRQHFDAQTERLAAEPAPCWMVGVLAVANGIAASWRLICGLLVGLFVGGQIRGVTWWVPAIPPLLAHTAFFAQNFVSTSFLEHTQQARPGARWINALMLLICQGLNIATIGFIAHKLDTGGSGLGRLALLLIPWFVQGGVALLSSIYGLVAGCHGAHRDYQQMEDVDGLHCEQASAHQPTETERDDPIQMGPAPEAP